MIVSEEAIEEFMNPEIVFSNPLLDYAYTRQDVENMVIATTRSHKDSEAYTPIDEMFNIRTSRMTT